MMNPQDTGLHPEQPDMPSRESLSSSTPASFTISPSLLNKLVHFAHDAILVRDPESHIIFWNEGAEHLYGWTAQEVLNKITHTLLQTHFPTSLDDLNQTLEQHGEWEGNLIHYRRDGAQIIVDSRQVLVRDEEGKPSAILEINRNITERHRLEQREKESEKLKGQFISLATHELLTPVTVIMGYANRLLSHSAQQHEHQLDEWQHEKVQEIKQAAWQLTSLTENLLDVTRMQAGLFELEQRSTDLLVLAGRVIKRLQTTTTLHQLIFQTTLAHLWAMVDVLRVEQVLSNLLCNAIKYTPRGGPIEVILEADQRMHEARFQIHDQSMGILLDQQAQLFGRFTRAENVRAAGIRGTGLGLYLCRELVERQGGHISFESAEGAGSTFFFSLPYQEIET